MSGSPRRSPRAALWLVLLALGCQSPAATGYDYFARPRRQDPWSLQILRWQVRAREDVAAQGRLLAAVLADPEEGELTADPEDLRGRYSVFVAQRKLELARQVARWAQAQAPRFYLSDDGLDHWPTLREVLASDGDDCDGLELLTYYLLRDLGFDPVYRAVMRRPSDGQHHMVTLWFETPGDPRVIDPTGAMTTGAPHMSQVPDWVPLKVFSETEEWSVRPVSRP